MRLVTLDGDQSASAGLVLGGQVVRLGVTIDQLLATPRSLWDVEALRVDDPIPLESVTLTAPVPRPGKIIAFGMNYRDHCTEQGVEPPVEPLVFAKFPSSVVGPDVAVSWPADVDDVDWEVELAVVVGVGPRGDAAVAGFTVANDVSARDLQARDGQFVRAKSLDTFCPMGPMLVTPDELPDPVHVVLSLDVNGVEMQRSDAEHCFSASPSSCPSAVIISTSSPAT